MRHDARRVVRVLVGVRAGVSSAVRERDLAVCSYCPPSKTGRRSSTGAGSRLLVMDCPMCPGMPLRASFSSVTRCGYPLCGSCGSVYVFRCPGEHLSYCDAREDDPNRHPVLADHAGRSSGIVETVVVPRTGNVAARFRCHCCAGFVAGENAQCKRCRSVGPHHHGEDGGQLGNAHRKRARRNPVQRVSRVASVAATTSTDLPF